MHGGQNNFKRTHPCVGLEEVVNLSSERESLINMSDCVNPKGTNRSYGVQPRLHAFWMPVSFKTTSTRPAGGTGEVKLPKSGTRLKRQVSRTPT